MAEVTGLRNNALPYPIYAQPFGVTFPILDADGDLVTGATTPDAERSLNGDTFADCTNESTEIATNSGVYYLLLTAAEMTADVVTVIAKCATAGAKTTVLTLYPRKLVTLRSGTAQGGAAGSITLDSGASAVDDFYNGCVVAGVLDSTNEVRVITDYTGSSKVAAVTPNWNVTPDSDDTFIVYLPEGMQKPSVNITHAAEVAWGSGAITAGSIAADAITAAKVADGTIDAATFAAGAITATVIADGAIDAATFAAGAITATVIADGAIDAATFAAGAINAAAIAADAITDAKVAADVTIASVTGAVGSVTGAVGSVTGAVGSVTGSVGSVAAGGITAASFGAGAIDAAALAADAGTEIGTAVWASATRVLTAGTNIALAKGTGVTGFTDLSAAQVEAAILDDADGVETGVTPRQALRALVAMLAGVNTGAGTGTEVFKNPDGTTTRLTITVDAQGNRSVIVGNL